MLAGWLLRWQGQLWRQLVWERIWREIRVLERATGGRLSPRWTGWRLQGPGLRVEWMGGLRGLRTRVRSGSSDVTLPGLVGQPGLERALGRSLKEGPEG